jgi:2-polyprenyl-3-methyl-5-hydroxy-6-metoxy-1,4-benzoquinol methylase
MYGDERWDFISDSLPSGTGSVLDIGSYFGYFAHRFEELGYECYAVEPDPENLAVLKRYRDMKGKSFTVWEKSVFDIDRFRFDIVLALNIFHHLVKDEQDYERLTAFLQRLQCMAMYFEPHENTEPYAYKCFSDREFIDYVLGNSLLSQSRFLGRAREGRNLYQLTI